MEYLASCFKCLMKTRLIIVAVKMFFQLMESVKDCFVTGKWQACEDAEALLGEDGRSLLLLLSACPFWEKYGHYNQTPI